MLVYDPKGGELVRVGVPLWLARKAGELSLGDEDDEGVQLARRCLAPENLKLAGKGVLVEIEGDDGEQVLVWLK